MARRRTAVKILRRQRKGSSSGFVAKITHQLRSQQQTSTWRTIQRCRFRSNLRDSFEDPQERTLLAENAGLPGSTAVPVTTNKYEQIKWPPEVEKTEAIRFGFLVLHNIPGIDEHLQKDRHKTRKNSFLSKRSLYFACTLLNQAALSLLFSRRLRRPERFQRLRDFWSGDSSPGTPNNSSYRHRRILLPLRTHHLPLRTPKHSEFRHIHETHDQINRTGNN